MFNLINVYGIITFNASSINVSVMSNENRNNNCLYYHTLNFELNYLKNNYKYVVDTLNKELINVDKYLGFGIKRYVINVPHLLMNIKPCSTSKIKFENESKLMNYLTNLNNEPNTTNLKQQIIGYFQDEKFSKNLPINGKPYIVSYLNYSCENQYLNNILKLIQDLKIVVLSFYNNATSFQLSNSKTENKSSKILIDLTKKATHIYAYDVNNHIVNSQKINLGIDHIKAQISEIINILDLKIVDKLLHNYQHLLEVDDQDITVANIHNESFLNISTLTLRTLKEIAVYLVKPYFECIQQELNINNFSEVFFNCDDDIKYLFNCALNTNDLLNKVSINNINVCLTNKTVFGLENENISNLVWILDGINNEKELHPSIQYLTSIDPYVSEELNNSNFQQNLLMKFGILATNLSAKLGMQMDEIWKN